MIKDSWEAALQEKLLTNRRIVRPAKFGDKVPVDILLAAKYLQEISTSRQTFSIMVSLVLFWQDDSLRWDPADYDNATIIELPALKVWTPRIIVSNSADTVKVPKLAEIEHTGRATIHVYDTFTAMCAMDATLFPFDTQTCKLIISGWGRVSRLFENYTAIRIETGSFLINNDWEFLDAHIKNNHNVPFKWYSTSQPEFIFKFKRRPDFYIATMIVPLSILSFLGVLVFPLPVDSGEKVSYGISCFLSFFVVQASIIKHLPSSFSCLPYIVLMLQLLMVLNAVFVTMTITSVRFAINKPLKKIPRWLETLFKRSNKITDSKTGSITSLTTSVTTLDPGSVSNTDLKDSIISKSSTNLSDTITEKSDSVTDDEHCEGEWKAVTDSVNMMAFWLFVLGLFVITLVIIVSMATS